MSLAESSIILNGLVALGTLALAIATLFTILSHEKEKRLELQDRRLKEIIEILEVHIDWCNRYLDVDNQRRDLDNRLNILQNKTKPDTKNDKYELNYIERFRQNIENEAHINKEKAHEASKHLYTLIFLLNNTVIDDKEFISAKKKVLESLNFCSCEINNRSIDEDCKNISKRRQSMTFLIKSCINLRSEFP
jgi:hypothetical protein